MVSVVMGTLHSRFIEKDIKEFEDFHVAVLDIFSIFNSSLPGKHYDVPPRRKVEECFSKWKAAANPSQQKEIFIEFMKNNISLSRLDDYSLMTGVVTPPVAMASKKAGETYVPQLKIIKSIPDVVFVPSATLLALISAKISRKLFFKNIASA